jgi:hypothetical protein
MSAFRGREITGRLFGGRSRCAGYLIVPEDQNEGGHLAKMQRFGRFSELPFTKTVKPKVAAGRRRLRRFGLG